MRTKRCSPRSRGGNQSHRITPRAPADVSGRLETGSDPQPDELSARARRSRPKHLAPLLALAVLALASDAWSAAPATPRLNLATTDPQSDVLSWEETTEPFYVEELTSLEGPWVWMPLLDTGREVGGVRQLVLPKQPGMRFFQLRRDPDLAELLLNHALSLAADLPLETAWSDACPDLPFLDRFNPVRWSPLVGVPRTLDGGFVLVPGLWHAELESFCLKTGTPGPSEGEGYVPASLRGPRADIVAKIIRETSLDPSINQESAQILLWAIILRTPLSTLPPSLQSLAAQLLSVEELNRVAVASARKGRQDEAYARRFMLTLGRLFEELPEGIRQLLNWDEVVKQGLARAEDLTYEEIQDLAFAATAPPVPPEPGRDIAPGRWAWLPATTAPPGGFLVRYLTGFYTEIVLELCVPEVITVETDTRGRITRIADLEGSEIRTIYDDTAPPLEIAGEPGAKGFALEAIQVIGPPDPEDPRRMLAMSRAGIGWVLVGGLTGGGAIQDTGRFQGAKARYDGALEHRTEVQRLDIELSRVHPGRPPGPAASAARLLNLANYCEGLRLAFADLPEDDPDLPPLNEQLGLAYRAWIAEFASFARGSAGGAALVGERSGAALAANGPPKQPDILDRTIFRLFDWMFGTRQYEAKPANPGRQNLGVSSRPTGLSKDQWEQNFAEHKKHSTIVTTTFKFAGMPSFLGIPQKIIEKLIGTNLELYRYAGDTIANAGADPPRQRIMGPALAAPPGAGLARTDYDVPTLEQVWDPGPLTAGPGISALRLARAQALQDRLLELAAHLHATVIAIQRQVGARDAGDEAWYSRQGAYAVHHARRAGTLMWDTAEALEAWLALLVEEGVEDPWVSEEELAAVITRLRTQGYTDEERAVLHHLGLSDAEIAVCLETAASAVIEPAGVAAWATVNDYAIVLRQLGTVLMQFPVSFPLRDR